MSYVAVSKVTFPDQLKERILAVGLAMIPIAQQHKGFKAISFHEARFKNETMLYWECESMEDHESCMRSAPWLALMKANAELFSEEGVAFSVDIYKKIHQ